MHVTGPRLEVDKETGLFAGTNTVEFYTLGHQSDRVHFGKYFSNLRFVCPRYEEDRELTTAYGVHSASLEEQWTKAVVVDPNKHEVVVDAIDHIERSGSRATGDTATEPNTRLFKFKITYEIVEVDTNVDEFAEIRKWRALEKLTINQVKLLGLEEQFIYLKLKYGKGKDIHTNEKLGNSF